MTGLNGHISCLPEAAQSIVGGGVGEYRGENRGLFM